MFMDKKLLWMLVGFSLILCSSAQADLTDNIMAWWSFDNETISGLNVQDVSGDIERNGTNNGVDWVTGFLNEGGDFVIGNTDDIDLGATLTEIDYNTPFSVSFWTNTALTASDAMVIARQQSGGNFVGWWIAYDNGKPQLGMREAAADNFHCTTPDVYADGNWKHIVITYDGSEASSGITMYINGTETACTEYDAGSISTANSGTNAYIGSQNNAQNWFDDVMDELAILNMTLNQTGVDELYNNGTDFNPYLTDFITIELNSPANNESFNVDSFTVNFNYSSSDVSAGNCTLYINGTANATSTNIASGTNNTEINATGLSEGEYSWILGCKSSTVAEINTTARIVYMDTTYPSVSVSSLLGTNRTIVYTENITASMNCSDTNLYSFKVYVDGIHWYNQTNIAGTSINYNFSYSPSNEGLSAGIHTIEVNCSDGHTALTIPDWNLNKNLGEKSLKFIFGKDFIKIFPSNKGLFTTFDAIKQGDRYIFEYERDLISKLFFGDEMKFIVSSSKPLDISKKDNYKGWIVSDALNKWIDFESQYPNAVVLTKRISPYAVEVTINGIEEDKVIFNSIGELNTVSNHYTFYYGTITETYISDIIESETASFTLNFTINSSYVSDIVANLTYNESSYGYTKTTGSNFIHFLTSLSVPYVSALNETFNFSWSYNVTGINNTILNSTNVTNQTVYRIFINNCSNVTSTNSINFTVKDELDDSLVNVTVASLFEVWKISSYVRSLPLSYGGTYNPHFCIYPSWAWYNVDYEIQYSADGYETRTYFEEAINLSNVTRNIDLFLLGSGNETEITVYVVDELDNPLQAYLVEAWKYDLATNSYDLIDIKSTDLDGITVFELDVEDNDYRFYVKKDGETLYDSGKMTLNQVEYTFTIITTQQESSTHKVYLIGGDVTLNRTSRTFTFTWNDLNEIISRARLYVYEGDNASNFTVLYNSYSTSYSGTLSYTIANVSGVYVANGYFTLAEDNTEYLADSENFDDRAAYQVYDRDSIAQAIIFIGTITILALISLPEIAGIVCVFALAIFVKMGFVWLSGGAVVGIFIVAILVYRRMNKN